MVSKMAASLRVFNIRTIIYISPSRDKNNQIPSTFTSALLLWQFHYCSEVEISKIVYLTYTDGWKTKWIQPIQQLLFGPADSLDQTISVLICSNLDLFCAKMINKFL